MAYTTDELKRKLEQAERLASSRKTDPYGEWRLEAKSLRRQLAERGR